MGEEVGGSSVRASWTQWLRAKHRGPARQRAQDARWMWELARGQSGRRTGGAVLDAEGPDKGADLGGGEGEDDDPDPGDLLELDLLVQG